MWSPSSPFRVPLLENGTVFWQTSEMQHCSTKIMEGVAEQGSVEGRHHISSTCRSMQLWWWVLTDLEQTEWNNYLFCFWITGSLSSIMVKNLKSNTQKSWGWCYVWGNLQGVGSEQFSLQAWNEVHTSAEELLEHSCMSKDITVRLTVKMIEVYVHKPLQKLVSGSLPKRRM